MGVYIEGMEMPRSCAECPVNMNICKRGYKYLLAHMELYDQRADDCHIIPVPPHGDLVDLSSPFVAQYYDEMKEEWMEKSVTVGDALYDCMVWGMPPTIIPAEEGEA